MCERRSDSTTRPHLLADSVTDRPAPEPAGSPTRSPTQGGAPFDDTFGYRVTKEGLKALQEFEERHGKRVLRKALLPDTVAEALADEAWRDRRQQRRKEAEERGNRLVTVCGRWRHGRKVPDLRLMGRWLERAGFDLGRHCEIEVEPGTLTIRAL